MFDCRKTREFFDLYLDNELESVPTKHVAEHLDQCPQCRREFELMRAQNELLASSIKDQPYDITQLRAEIEAATIGKASLRLPEFSLRRIWIWALTLGCILIVAVAALFYFREKTNWSIAFPLYQTAAADHLACSADSAAPDWIRSQAEISELASSFFNRKQNVPASVGGEYRLARARICNFDGVKFLHVIYESQDGRYVSLFGRSAAAVPQGELTATVNGRALQLAHVSGLAVVSAGYGDDLVLAAATDENVASSAINTFRMLGES